MCKRLVPIRSTVCAVIYLTVIGLPWPTGVAFGWGDVGHMTVCEIAYTEFLTPSAKQKIDQIVGTKNGRQRAFARQCIWPDQVKRLPPWGPMRSAHFINYEDDSFWGGTPFPINSRTGQQDLDMLQALQGTKRSIERLLGERGSEKNRRKLLCHLRFLGHIAGDAHQPLHVGRGSDRGGNEKRLKWGNFFFKRAVAKGGPLADENGEVVRFQECDSNREQCRPELHQFPIRATTLNPPIAQQCMQAERADEDPSDCIQVEIVRFSSVPIAAPPVGECPQRRGRRNSCFTANSPAACSAAGPQCAFVPGTCSTKARKDRAQKSAACAQHNGRAAACRADTANSCSYTRGECFNRDTCVVTQTFRGIKTSAHGIWDDGFIDAHVEQLFGPKARFASAQSVYQRYAKFIVNQAEETQSFREQFAHLKFDSFLGWTEASVRFRNRPGGDLDRIRRPGDRGTFAYDGEGFADVTRFNAAQSRAYAAPRFRIIAANLVKGGAHLAGMLNRIFDGRRGNANHEAFFEAREKELAARIQAAGACPKDRQGKCTGPVVPSKVAGTSAFPLVCDTAF